MVVFCVSCVLGTTDALGSCWGAIHVSPLGSHLPIGNLSTHFCMTGVGPFCFSIQDKNFDSCLPIVPYPSKVCYIWESLWLPKRHTNTLSLIVRAVSYASEAKGCLALCSRCMPAMKTSGTNGQVMTSLRVTELELCGVCWKPFLKASQLLFLREGIATEGVRRGSTNGYHIWGRTSPGGKS